MIAGLMGQIGEVARSVAFAVTPLIAFFVVFQLLFLRLPRSEVARVLRGTAVAAAGLFLFLLGVGVGFLPFGRVIGESLGKLGGGELLFALGLLLGFVTTWGEPAVRILATEIEEATTGSIRAVWVLHAICLGVALATGFGLLRIAYDIPILWLLLPGYLVVLAIMWATASEFVAVAVDAGGVATGPLANTFLLALALGTASAAGGRDPLVHGLGLVSLIALAPVISVMALGALVRWKERQKEVQT